ncbi:DUF3489 domain-containing protein [Sphingomonas naphthae]|uniref:DUF3489 domain-containing protein n=1 Tax=Sphingomonas naphthae TaxID=1813468 RepID=A0ABY7TIA5_9SPHN|nr:DUF3489 domain-containing protein [Sphingomonas naphthae]WCT72160.1 DUF3489 domain-containing protein [Sphingomonas naphthae]
MAKLTDTQTILLSTAAQRDDRNLHPLPPAITNRSRVTMAITSLIKAGLVEERETGTFATDAGLAAIGVEVGQGTAPESAAPASPEAAERPAVTPARVTKIDGVLTLLRQPDGATQAELIAVTGWLPHTMRAALTGLRKKGYAVERGKRDGATCYQITAAA